MCAISFRRGLRRAMPIYLDTAREAGTRATTTRVMAAIEAFIGWMLCGPRQHDADLLAECGTLPRFTAGENRSEGGR